ncbi:riboflavin synthase [Burkholderiaceae bacterium DAT-1]|nr:riboflavin synthase [Burkholderiaceae bacterium DAT-1]
MFTGLVEATGTIGTVQPIDGHGLRVMIVTEDMDLTDVLIGESIAIDGACMTVISKTERSFKVDVSAESLRCTHGLDDPGRVVNLERALRLGDRLGGHMVSGHVDGVGEVRKFEQVGDCVKMVVQGPKALAKYLATKGSIVVNGVSLTTNLVKNVMDRCVFSCNLVPHTLECTNLRLLEKGAKVNLEVDMIARYVERLMQTEDEDLL